MSDMGRLMRIGALAVGVCWAMGACGQAGGNAPAVTTTSSTTTQFPANDTMWSHASTQLQNVWRQVLSSGGADPNAAEIPGREVIANMPAPPVAGETAEAVQRTSALAQFGEAHAPGLFLYLVHSNIDPRISAALDSGTSVIDPDCDVFASSITIVQPSTAVSSWLGSSPQVVVDTILPGGLACNATIGGTSVSLNEPNNVNIVYGGHVAADDPALGLVFIAEVAKSCGSGPQQVPASCG